MPEPGSKRIKHRIATLLAREAHLPLRWWYLSFADGKFLGGVILEAHGFTSAIQKSHDLGINPGGGVEGFEIIEGKIDLVPEDMRNRLLSRPEVDALEPREKPVD